MKKARINYDDVLQSKRLNKKAENKRFSFWGGGGGTKLRSMIFVYRLCDVWAALSLRMFYTNRKLRRAQYQKDLSIHTAI